MLRKSQRLKKQWLAVAMHVAQWNPTIQEQERCQYARSHKYTIIIVVTTPSCTAGSRDWGWGSSLGNQQQNSDMIQVKDDGERYMYMALGARVREYVHNDSTRR